jgi:hypothetical protein
MLAISKSIINEGNMDPIKTYVKIPELKLK